MKCRFCKNESVKIFLDLGVAPLSNNYLKKNELKNPEIQYPLKVCICKNCNLVQLVDYNFLKPEKIFNHHYAYLSSVSSSWVEHSRKYAEMIIKKLKLNKKSFVVEVASNDGYLLKNFVSKKISCLGVEPALSGAKIARKKKINVLNDFFNISTSKKIAKKKQADLIIANNVYAHVPDINDFTRSLKILLKKNGTITIEFPHILELIKNNQFDTIYHEHFFYFSIKTVSKIFKKHRLKIYDVETINTHGGSLRIYGCHLSDKKKINKSVINLIRKEKIFGLDDLKTYLNFQTRVEKIKNNLLLFLIKNKTLNNKIYGYGAAAKANTILNFAGIKNDLLPFIFDKADTKRGKYMPGSHIPILSSKLIKKHLPDYLLIFTWNILNEIINEKSLINKKIKLLTIFPKVKIIKKK